MGDKKIVPFRANTTNKTTVHERASDRLNQLKETLDQRLQEKHRQEQATEQQRLKHEARNQASRKRLVSGLFAALLLGSTASAGWALANKANEVIMQDKDKLTSEFTQMKDRNQQLERENASLLTKLEVTEKNAKTLDVLSANLGKTVEQLKLNRSELILKLDQSTATIEQLYKDKAIQADAFKNLSQANQTLEKTNSGLVQKISVLKSIFDQGRSLLSTNETKQPPAKKEG